MSTRKALPAVLISDLEFGDTVRVTLRKGLNTPPFIGTYCGEYESSGNRRVHFATDAGPVCPRVMDIVRDGLQLVERAEPELCTVALVKGDERYVFVYEAGQVNELTNVLGQFAENPELSFTWDDAAVLSMKVRERSEP